MQKNVCNKISHFKFSTMSDPVQKSNIKFVERGKTNAPQTIPAHPPHTRTHARTYARTHARRWKSTAHAFKAGKFFGI